MCIKRFLLVMNVKYLMERGSFSHYLWKPYLYNFLSSRGVWNLLVKYTLTSSGQHRRILTAIDYFTKWIEAFPTRQATYSIIIHFLENNILSKFWYPTKIIIDNAQAFKSKKLVIFCSQYNITLGHSTTYYPQGNGLVES